MASSLEGEIVRIVNTRMPRAVPIIKVRFQRLIEEAVLQSPEYDEITLGRVRHELGLVGVIPVIESIIGAMQESMLVQYTPMTFSTPAMIRVSILRKDLREVLNLPSSLFISENGEIVYWLKWVLSAGSDIVLTDYQFDDKFSKASRTGRGIMRRGRKGWSVPSSIAGTVENNWLTRAFESKQDDMITILTQEVMKVF